MHVLEHPGSATHILWQVSLQISLILLAVVKPAGICHDDWPPTSDITVVSIKALNSAAVCEHASCPVYTMFRIGPLVTKKSRPLSHSLGMKSNAG